MSGKREINLLVSRIAIVLALISFLTIAFWLNLSVRAEQQFALLAQSFLHGQLHFLGPPGGTWSDTTPYGDRHYWPLGPLPAVLLMPFEFVGSLIGKPFYQGYLQIVLVVAALVLLFRIARRLGYTRDDAAYAAFGLCFASAFLGVAFLPWSWYFAQVITCLALFCVVLEMIGQRRPLVVGILFAVCLGTRATAALGLVWFIGEVVLTSAVSKSEKARSIGIALCPCAIVLALLLLYNYARFGNVFEQGYSDQIIPETAANLRSIGILSLRHMPANLYALLLASPVPILSSDAATVLRFPFFAANPWGMSMFVTAPWLVCLFGLRYGDTTSRLVLATIVIIAVPLLLYYAVGYRQFGYRYSLDFLPLLYYLFLRNYRQQRGNLSALLKIAFVFSAVWDLNLFAGHYLWHLT